jgi:hypothetical protein
MIPGARSARYLHGGHDKTYPRPRKVPLEMTQAVPASRKCKTIQHGFRLNDYGFWKTINAEPNIMKR